MSPKVSISKDMLLKNMSLDSSAMCCAFRHRAIVQMLTWCNSVLYNGSVYLTFDCSIILQDCTECTVWEFERFVFNCSSAES